ncbi:MAG: cyclic di-GMP phosphodiesterase [Fusobacteriaceae bacterium]|jgi:putative two-component system response regulator|nr:two-component system response regulator [Fusobacteriales bacterium]MDN5303555.1 cyclic di-GMP phosphodiesterase [Fusobacteriaceae bacterium]
MEELLKNQKILIVDDTPENIDVLAGVLSDYKRTFALNGKKVLEKVFSDNPPDLILLDVMMPEMDGYEVCKILKQDYRSKNIPVIFITAKTNTEDEAYGLSLGAVDYINKPINPEIVKARVKTHLMLKIANEKLEKQNKELEKEVEKRTEKIAQTEELTIRTLASLAETRDNETGEHILRTQYYVKVLAEYLKNNPKYSELRDEKVIKYIFKSAPLHDIGKVGVPDKILLKPGKLTFEEFEEMKKHAIYGRDALLKADKALHGESFLHYAMEIAYTHHEKWDGSGYPRGLKGEDIPVSGRLMALADVYDALISKRVYKPAFSHEKAKEIILAGKGTHFDPDIVDAFIALEEVFKTIANKYKD